MKPLSLFVSECLQTTAIDAEKYKEEVAAWNSSNLLRDSREWAKMESFCCSLTRRIFQTLAKGIMRESGWTVIGDGEKISLASGIKFHRSNRPFSFSLFHSPALPWALFLFHSRDERLRERRCWLKVCAVSLSFASRLTIFLIISLYSRRAAMWQPLFDGTSVTSRETSPLCVQVRFKKKTEESDVVNAFIREHILT